MGYGSVNVPGNLPHKQDALTGLPHQVVRFDGMGLPYAAEGWSGRNLLINSDLRNPVNRNGKSEYGAAGYTIDMWTMTGTASSLTLEDDGICFLPSASTNGVRQYIRDPSALAGRTVTMSILVGAENGTSVRCGCNDGALHYSDFVSSGIAEVTVSINENVEELFVFFQCDKVAKSPPIRAAKLELGDHQTLARQNEDGGWELIDPPDYDLQYALCCLYSPSTGEWVGYQHSNENLLDDWYFPAPVNQRGQTEYTADKASLNTIDRWGICANTKMTLSENGITISAIADGTAQLYQYLPHSFKELAGCAVTLSFLTADGSLYTASGTIGAAEPAATANYILLSIPGIGTLCLTYSPASGRKKFYAHIINTNAAAGPIATLKAAKMELGPVQTLAHKEGDAWVLNDPPPNKALELEKCQRYQLIIPASGVRYPAQQVMRDTIDFTIPIPAALRTAPVINTDCFTINTHNTESGAINGAAETGFTFKLFAAVNNAIAIRATKNGWTDYNSRPVLRISSSLILDANL